MVRRGLNLVAVLVLGATFAAAARPAAAHHRDGAEAQGPGTSGAVRLPGSGGYALTLSTADDLVRLEAFQILQRELGGFASAAYAVRPESPLGSGELRADFGPVGRVALRFEPDGKRRTEVRDRHCRGRRPVREWGRYTGAVELRGEGGYFEVRVASAPGARERSFRLVCQRGHAEKTAPGPLSRQVEPGLGFGSGGASLSSLLRVEAVDPGRRVGLRAADQLGGTTSQTSAGVLESSAEMAIGRSATLYLPIGPVRVTSMQPLTAGFDLFDPFGGEASYSEGPAAPPTWTGSLSVSLPGLVQPLTGPEFAADLCIRSPGGRGCAKLDRRLLPG